MYDLTASIVLYKTNVNEIRETIRGILQTKLKIKLYLIDNSPTDTLKDVADDNRIEYIFNNANLGYGTAHNIALLKAIEDNIPYHAVINPDIFLQEDTLAGLHQYMEQHPGTGLAMPKITNEEGVTQPLCKLLPSPFDLLGRRFFGNTKWAEKRNARYELRQFTYNSILNTPCLSGCFMFIRTSILKKAGIFDPRFFMYLEDYDLTRRIHQHAQTEFYPFASAIHGHQKESYKSKLLLKIHLQSAFSYFNKWGWLFDRNRKKWNKEVLNRLKN